MRPAPTSSNMGLGSGDAARDVERRAPRQDRKAVYDGCRWRAATCSLTNSFGGNAARLKLHGAERRARALSRIAAEIGREVADRQGPPGDRGWFCRPHGRDHGTDGRADARIGGRDIPRTGRRAERGWRRRLVALKPSRPPANTRPRPRHFTWLVWPWCGTMSFGTPPGGA